MREKASPAVGRRLAPLLPAVGASYFGYAMMVTLFVPMIMSRSAGYLPADASLAHRTSVLGLLLVLYPLGQFFGNSALGALSDRYGRRPVLLGSGLATVLCYVGLAVALEIRELTVLALFLVLCGLVEANTALVMSAVADVTDEKQRPSYIALVYAVTSVAYTVGPLAGGALAAAFGYALPFWVVLGALVAVLIWLQVAFSETHRPDRAHRVRWYQSLAGLGLVITDKALRAQYLANLCAFIAVMGFGRVITIYLVDRWHLDVGQVTAYYSVLAIGAGLANFLLTPRLLRRMATRTLALVALAAGAVAMATIVVPAAINLPGSLFLAVGLATAACVVLAVGLAAVSALLSQLAPADQQGTAMGNNAALLVLGEVIGVSGGAFLAGIRPAIPLLVLAGLAAAAFAIMRMTGRRSAPPATDLRTEPLTSLGPAAERLERPTGRDADHTGAHSRRST